MTTVAHRCGLFVPKPSTGGDCQCRSTPGLGQVVYDGNMPASLHRLVR